MRKLLTILFIAPFLSCSIETDEPVVPNIVGEWVLVQTWGQFRGSEQTGAEMPFQETYQFNEDGSFVKTRVRDGEELEARGTYHLPETGWTVHGEAIIAFIEVEHESENPLLANCTSTLTEHLYLTTSGKLKSTHEACDGLGVLYEKLD